eukprot:NODE_4523_length_574_cov_1.552381_g3286_i0.p5 GENE.NODE_4523_length_574_cov_1.552381_g3286_i0~~NODE_4523_length_574_cov_1.552381_g3286_i0.p5  ORF type:complete len:67 (+),score=3.60 NODE_4523_length_574_cov_1.552381_g3286_i0:124-324(+)
MGLHTGPRPGSKEPAGRAHPVQEGLVLSTRSPVHQPQARQHADHLAGPSCRPSPPPDTPTNTMIVA